MNLNTPKITLTTALLSTISLDEIIYAEIAEPGAMGNAGGILLYVVKEGQFTRYETSVFNAPEAYASADELIKANQNEMLMSGTMAEKKTFVYYYGGMGNHVYVNNNTTLRAVEDHFLVTQNNVEYKIDPSNKGVFMNVEARLK